ncbi:F-box/kelch-repeat protein At3g06240-like [Vicia villosa]|nr:F-box/kelch-repeat protein At3g06240-like [Vicia villosa]
MKVIIAFDLTERKLFEMPYPNGVGQNSDHYELWVYQEFLSLWTMDCKNSRIEIWLMKEYNVNSSWIKAIVFPVQILSPHQFSPICSTKNGDIIVTNGTRLLRYNDKGELIEGSSYRCFPDSAVSRGSPSIVYTESFLSLPGDGTQS